MQPTFFHRQYGRIALESELLMISLMSIAIFYSNGFRPMSVTIIAVLLVPKLAGRAGKLSIQQSPNPSCHEHLVMALRRPRG